MLRGILILAIALLPLAAVAAQGSNLQQTAIPEPMVIGEVPGRDQLVPQASDRFVVWEDAAIESNPMDKSWYESSDISGYDLQTGLPFIVTDAPGRQSMPEIFDTLVVWEDKQHSCATCEADIHGKDLESGEEFSIADGPADQSFPTIAGRTVAWIEYDGQRSRILAKNLDDQAVFEVAVSNGATFGPPAMSEDLIVWSETTSEPPYYLNAYDLGTKEVITVGAAYHLSISLNYAVDGKLVVWAAPQLMLSDLDAGTSNIIKTVSPVSPHVKGETVLWSAPVSDGSGQWVINGLQLHLGIPVALVDIAGTQNMPTIGGGWLIWQTADWTSPRRIVAIPLLDAFRGGVPLITDTPQREDAEPLTHDTSKTTPTKKGMHTAISGNWEVDVNGTMQACWPAPDPHGCPAVDALGTLEQGAFFGSYLVIDFDLKDIDAGTPGIQHRPTGRCTVAGDPNCGKWGGFVYDAMRYLQLPTAQGGLGKRVVVRNYPTRYPDNLGTNVHYQVVDDILALIDPNVYNFDWIRHVQINNEPNQVNESPPPDPLGEWPQCTGCYWAANDVPETYTWSSRLDTDLYMAIDDFYTDVWWSLDWHKNNNPNALIRQRLAAMTFWTPPMTDIYGPVGGSSFYHYLHGMIWQYRNMTYHTYPSPSSVNDVDGTGGLKNNSWDYFDPWLIDHINDGSVKSMITEFGWNPGEMERCDVSHWDPWGSLPPTAEECDPPDGFTHRLRNDIQRFLTGVHLHNAEAVMVWLVRGWPRASGLQSNGYQWDWFHYYQWSDP